MLAWGCSYKVETCSCNVKCQWSVVLLINPTEYFRVMCLGSRWRSRSGRFIPDELQEAWWAAEPSGRLVARLPACSTVTVDRRGKTPLQYACLLQASCPMHCNLWTWWLDDCCFCCYCRWRRLPQVVRGRIGAEISCLVSAYTENFFYLFVAVCGVSSVCLLQRLFST